MNPSTLHIICEKDVGLFSLVHQVINHVPEAQHHSRIPVVFYGKNCCYWLDHGFEGKDSVWEYYFEPLSDAITAEDIPSAIKTHIADHFPRHTHPGYFIGENAFVTNHYGDHSQLRQTLKIPYKWKDPSDDIRNVASKIIAQYIRPRKYILDKVDVFFETKMEGYYVIGVHMRATDVRDKNEYNIHRRGSYNLDFYKQTIDNLLKEYDNVRIFVATDAYDCLREMQTTYGEIVISYSSIFHQEGEVAGSGPSGWPIPAYISEDPEKAAKNGEEAVIDYLLLSKCQYLIHSGSGLPRTALLKNPSLPFTNIHSRSKYFKFLCRNRLELFYFLKALLVVNYRRIRDKVKNNLGL